MIKRLSTSILIVTIIMIFFATPVLAVEAGEKRVTLGADLSNEQIDGIYADFGIIRGDVEELYVTNAEERKYLKGLVSEETIGHNALSSIYIVTLDEGAGISVSTYNINWCSKEMYTNALETAGITDAKIIVSAPFNVSGTAALTGVYKAYSDITGEPLDEMAKAAATEELIVTGELAEVIGSDDATKLINELKKILDQTREMTDEELKTEILYIADYQNLILTDDNVSQIMKLCRTLEKLDIDGWRNNLLNFGSKMQVAQNVSDGVSDFFTTVKDFFASFGDLF